MTTRRRPQVVSSATRTHLVQCRCCLREIQYRDAIVVTYPESIAGEFVHRGLCADKEKRYWLMHKVRIRGRFVSGNDGTEGVRVAQLPELFKVPA